MVGFYEVAHNSIVLVFIMNSSLIFCNAKWCPADAFEHVNDICSATIDGLDSVFFTCSWVVKNIHIGYVVTMYTVPTLVIAIGRVWEPSIASLG